MFTAKAEDLAAALSLVLTSSEKKGTMPVLAYVLVEGSDGFVKLTGTDIDSTIETKIEADTESFAWCVQGRKLADLVRLISGDVSLSLSGERVIVKSNQTEHKLPMLPRESFPVIETASEKIGDIEGLLFSEMLTTAMIAAETNPNGVDWQKNIEVIGKDGKLIITGCSNARISSVSIPFEGEVNAILPYRAAQILSIFAASAESLSLFCSAHLFTVRSETGAAHSRLSGLRMADWQALVSKEYQHQIELEPESFLPSLRRALLASDNGAVNITLSKNQAVLTAMDVDNHRQGKESAAVTCPSLNGRSYDLRLLGAQLIDYLKLCKSPVSWQINEGQSALRFTPKTQDKFDWQYIQTTLRMK